MLVIVGLIVLLVAAIVTIVGELSNAGAAHPPTETMRVRLSPHGVDRHVVPLWDPGRRGGAARNSARSRTGARRTASHEPDAQLPNMAFINRARDTRLEHQQRADSATVAPAPR